ncbi:MAG TPA: 4Fe-4S dicluster domain-containing protein [Elusimicrobiota bacterium]|nr:4Fe-4S dicluster domain-containing protein [Elusimicrobiota bacterium]
MFRIPRTRWRQKHRTIEFPKSAPVLPDRFRGLPVIDRHKCPADCNRCAASCPTEAIAIQSGALTVDLGRCLFCTDCREACPADALRYTNDYRLAVRRREDLYLDGRVLERARALDETARRIFGRSLKLRQVSAGGCNACEADVNVLQTVVFDLGRFGVDFVASPRHADGLLVTGAVSANMKLALEKTYQAVPPPKLVIAVGACAISGGPFRGHPEICDGVSPLLPVDLFVPGCPPHPLTILDGILRLLGRLPE